MKAVLLCHEEIKIELEKKHNLKITVYFIYDALKHQFSYVANWSELEQSCLCLFSQDLYCWLLRRAKEVIVMYTGRGGGAGGGMDN